MSEEYKKKLAENIRKIYISDFLVCTNFSLVVYTLFIMSKGFDLKQFFILESAYAFASMISQIPTGTFADRISKKTSIILSTIIIIPLIAVIILSHSFWVILVAMFISGVGNSFYTGADTAMMYETLKALGREDEYKKITGRGRLYGSIAAAIGGIFGGFLAHYKMDYAWWAYFAMQFPALLVDSTLVEPPRDISANEKSANQHVKDSLWHAFRGQAAFFVLYSAATWLFFSLGFWLWQPYLKAIAVPVIYFGFVYATINIISGFFSNQSHKIEKKIGMEKSLIYIPLVLLVAFLLQSTMLAVFGLAFLFIYAVANGYQHPVLDDYLNTRIPSANRATVFSLKYMIEDGVFIIFSPLLGHFVDLYSLKTAYLLMVAILAIITIVSWLVFRRQNISMEPAVV